jgi:phosphoenolpyruvate-protein phosphotransferase (PTS system enzyme I)
VNLGYTQVEGVSAARGVAIGKAFLYSKDLPPITRSRVPADRVEAETERFLHVLRQVADEIRRTRRLVEIEHGADLAQIFEAQLAMVEDVEVRDQTLAQIRQKNYSAERAFSVTLERTKRMFEKVENEYLRARLSDIIDIEHQVLVRLAGGELRALHALRSNTVVFAHDLLPSEAVQLERRLVKGLVTEVGGTTSHTSIIARSLGLPAVVGAGKILRQVRSHDLVIVDGDNGEVHLRPDAGAVRSYRNTLRRQRQRQRHLSDRRSLPAMTRDGYKVSIAANIDLPSEIDAAVKNGAGSVGMYRTEFLFLGYRLPNEDEQVAAYAKIIRAMDSAPVTIRTLDLGGDKLAHVLDTATEANPFLGWRGIRVCLDVPELFNTQLRAILRAGAGVSAAVRIMLPMVSDVDQVRQARRALEQAKEELAAEGVASAANPQLGIMVEVPAVALMVEQFAREVDFFSLGTNDLVQYSLAVDRGNAKVAGLYDSFHPAVLRLIAAVAAGSLAADVPLGVCGEMAGDPQAAVLLLGLGVESLSMSPGLIPEVKELVRQVDLDEVKALAARCLDMESGSQVREALGKFIG